MIPNYDFDFYFAERLTLGSNLLITTSIPFRNVEPPPQGVPDGGSLLAASVVVFGGMLAVARLLCRVSFSLLLYSRGLLTY